VEKEFKSRRPKRLEESLLGRVVDKKLRYWNSMKPNRSSFDLLGFHGSEERGIQIKET